MAENDDDKAKTAEKALPPDEKSADATKRTVVERTVVREVREPAPGPNAFTDPPEGQYFLSTAGKEINAWGEEKDSPEDKRRRAAGGIA